MDKRLYAKLVEFDLVDFLNRYFPYDVWDISYRNNRQSARRTFQIGWVWPRRKQMRLYSRLFEKDRDYVIHTILHEYAHYFLYSCGLPNGHTAEFWNILHILEQDEKCGYTQVKCGQTIKTNKYERVANEHDTDVTTINVTAGMEPKQCWTSDVLP